MITNSVPVSSNAQCQSENEEALDIDVIGAESDITPEPGFYTYFSVSRSIEELHEKILKFLQQRGFTDYVFLPMSGGSTEPKLLTLPRELVLSYIQEKYYRDDWVVKYAREHRRSIYITKVYAVAYHAPYDIDLFTINQKIYELYEQAGHFDSFLLPMQSCIDTEENVLLGVSIRGATFFELHLNVIRYLQDLRELGKAINRVTAKKFKAQFLAKCSISDEPVKLGEKPLQVLSTLANSDMTMAGVAAALHISTITANQHLAAVRKALDVTTTRGAIKKAVCLGLIEYT